MSATTRNPIHPIPDGVLRRLETRLAGWRKWRAERRELDALGCDTANRMLAECGLTLNDVDARVNPRVSQLLPEMMTAVGVDETLAPGARRDLERTCGACADWRRCELSLATGSVIETYHDFCANAATMDSLVDARPVEQNQRN